MNKRARKMRGGAAVEFALMLPLLLIMVFGITELGRALYQQNMLTKAVTSGARYMARAYGALDTDCVPTATWTSHIAAARDLVAFGSVDPGSGAQPMLPGLDETAAIDVQHDGPIVIAVPVGGATQDIRACTVTVSAHVPFASIFGRALIPMFGLGDVELNARAEERFIGD